MKQIHLSIPHANLVVPIQMTRHGKERPKFSVTYELVNLFKDSVLKSIFSVDVIYLSNQTLQKWELCIMGTRMTI